MMETYHVIFFSRIRQLTHASSDKERHLYQTPEVIKTEEQFLSFKNSITDYYVSFVAEDTKPLNESFNATYKSYKQAHYGHARPQMMVNESGWTLGFLEDVEDRCYLEIPDLPQNCNTLKQISALTYYKNISVLRRPEFLNKLLSEDTPKGLGDYFIPIRHSVTYFDVDSQKDRNLTSPDYPTPSWDSTTNTCNNVVHHATYTFVVNATSGFVSVTVSFAIGTLKETEREGLSALIKQKFTTKFLWDGDDPEVKMYRRSGNPGYRMGEPVTAGNLKLNTTTTEGEEPKAAILLNSDSNSWLSVVNSLYCSSPQRIPVKFGYNMQSGCLIE